MRRTACSGNGRATISSWGGDPERRRSPPGFRDRVLDDHAEAAEPTAEELIGRSPQVEPEPAEIELAELPHYGLSVAVEIAGPLLEREEIAVAVVEDLAHLQGRA